MHHEYASAVTVKPCTVIGNSQFRICDHLRSCYVKTESTLCQGSIPVLGIAWRHSALLGA